MNGAVLTMPDSISHLFTRPKFGSKNSSQPVVTPNAGRKNMIQKPNSMVRANGTSVRASTQAMPMAIGNEMPCTAPCTLIVLTIASRTSGSLKAIFQVAMPAPWNVPPGRTLFTITAMIG